MKKIAILGLLALVLPGCGSVTYLNREGRVVAVLPPIDHTNAPIEAWEKMWPMFEHEAAVRGYAVVPVGRVREWMTSKKINSGGELKQWTHAELAKEFGADFVLVTELNEWDRTTAIIYTKLAIGVSATLVDKEGGAVWHGEGSASEEAAGLIVRDIAGQTVAGLVSSMEHLMHPAVADCMGTLPHCGFEPK